MKRHEKIQLLHQLSTGQITKIEFLKLTGGDQTWLCLDGESSRCVQTGEVKTREQMEAYTQEHGGFMKVTLNI